MRWTPAVVLVLLSAAAGATQLDFVGQGAVALQKGDPAAARTAFESALEGDPEDAKAWLGLSAANELIGDWPKALQAARRAAALAPEQPEVQFALARLLGQAGELEQALVAFERTRALAPQLDDAYLLPALLLRDVDREADALALLEAGWSRAPSARLGEQLAFLALATGDAGRALEVVEGALLETPEAGDLLLAKALALAADAARRIEAPAWFAKAVAVGVAQEGPARLEWARLLGELERWSEAATQLEAAGALMPTEPEVFFRLAAARRLAGDAEGAAAALARYQELNAAVVAAERRVREIGTALNEAQELAGANRLDEALDRLAAISGGDTDPRVMMLRGKVLLSLGRGEEALAAAQVARDLAPNEVEPAYLTALFAFGLGRFTDSMAAIEQALALAPGFAEGWALYGSALARSARLGEAAASFERALELGFDSAALRLDYAGVLSDLGRAEESREQLAARELLIGG